MPISAMLRFVQILPDVSEKGDFILKDLPGSGKRIDVLCRDLAACFDWGPSKWPTTQLELIALIGESKILQFGKPVEEGLKGERAWAQIIQNSLKGNPPKYVHVSDGDLESIVKEYNNPPKFRFWVLHEQGKPMKECKFDVPGTQNSFMLGNHRGFNSKTEELISNHALWKVTLGKISYLSSHCVASIISQFERMV